MIRNELHSAVEIMVGARQLIAYNNKIIDRRKFEEKQVLSAMSIVCKFSFTTQFLKIHV